MYKVGKNYITDIKKPTIKLVLCLIVYVLIGWGLRIIFDYWVSGKDVGFILWIRLRMGVIQFLYLLIGFMVIFWHFGNKPWRYLKEIISATEIIYSKNDQLVILSEPLKSVEEQLNQIKMSVMLADKAIHVSESKKNELVAYLAHDIRTPLTSIIGYLSMINDMPNMPADKRNEYLKRMLEKTMHLEQLVDEFFEITQYNTQQININKQDVDLSYLFIQLADEFRPMLEKNNNSLELRVAEHLRVSIDPDKMSRVFSNLLRNAVSYSYSGTDIIITAELKDNTLNIVFENSGDTIPEHKLSGIFEKFSRLDKSRASETGGAGLGLYIAKEIIALHGGQIVADSRNNTIFFNITIPMK